MLEFTNIQSSVFQYASFHNAKGGILGYKRPCFVMRNMALYNTLTINKLEQIHFPVLADIDAGINSRSKTVCINRLHINKSTTFSPAPINMLPQNTCYLSNIPAHGRTSHLRHSLPRKAVQACLHPSLYVRPP